MTAVNTMTRKQFILAMGAICLVTACVIGWAAWRKPDGPAVPLPVKEPKESAPPVIRFEFDGPVADNGVPAPWIATVSAGNLQAKVVALHEESGGKEAGDASSLRGKSTENGSALWVRSDRASFLLTNRREFDVATYPVLRWSWKATVLPTDGDVRKNALLFGENRNDQAVQLLVVFEDRKVLSFVWDSTAPVGTEVDEPSPLAMVKTRVVDSGSEHLQTWRRHEVDLHQEYSRRFGKPPGKAVGVIVQSNANHTQSIGEGFFKEITVSAY